MILPAHFLDITIRSTIDPDEPPQRKRINYARPEAQEHLRRLIHSVTSNGYALHIEAMPTVAADR